MAYLDTRGLHTFWAKIKEYVAEHGGGGGDVTYEEITPPVTVGDPPEWLDLVYPVGCYYWSADSTDPGNLFGGIWVSINDKFIYSTGVQEVGDTGNIASGNNLGYEVAYCWKRLT